MKHHASATAQRLFARIKKLLQRVFSRAALTGIFIVLQVAVLALAMRYLEDQFAYFSAACLLISAALLLFIAGRDGLPEYKIAWMLPIAAAPVFGALLYLLFGRDRMTKRQKRRMKEIETWYTGAMARPPQSVARYCSAEVRATLEAGFPDGARMSDYLRFAARTPAFSHTETTYLPTGEAMFAALLPALKSAQKSILFEYYIIETGRMWDAVHALLRDRAAAGVDVRVLCDDFGTMFRIPDGFVAGLEAEGIRCKVFNRFVPSLSSRFNNRDHRKICVVDGNIGFTGGVNIADRYANAGGYDGHWLDSAVMLRGAGVWGLTCMFLSLWDYVYPANDDPYAFVPDDALSASLPENGFVQPFMDTPLDNEPVGATVYMQLLHRAKHYVYINTPYLIIDNGMFLALTTAAKSGVDVRIVTPRKGDSALVQEMTRSYYHGLLAAGVKIYEYTPGMVHAKTFVSDDAYAVVGTINLDYRSLYLHFECAAWLCGASAVAQVKRAFLAELTCCEAIEIDRFKAQSLWRRIQRAVLRLLAPLF